MRQHARILVGLGITIPLAMAPGAAAASAPEAAVPASKIVAAAPTHKVLEMNLCNGGGANCWDSKPGPDKATQTMREAVKKIEALKPTIVTLTEVCSKEVAALKRRIKFSGDSFFNVLSGSSNAKCTGGRGDYGTAILDKRALPKPYVKYRYEERLTSQANSEKRVMGCRKTDTLTVCVTHLSDKPTSVTKTQCEEVMHRAKGFAGRTRLIIAGDFNLKYKGNPDVQDCVPSGFSRKGDGNRQHIFIRNTLRFGSTGTQSMNGYSDHPAFWATMS